MVLALLLPFCMVYLCLVLSVLIVIIAKYWSTLKNVEDVLGPALLNIQTGSHALGECGQQSVSLAGQVSFYLSQMRRFYVS